MVDNRNNSAVYSQKQIDGANTRIRDNVTSGSYSLLAFFFGDFGVHNFITGQYLYGWIHLGMATVGLVLIIMGFVSSFLPPTLLFASWVWAIWEAINYRKSNQLIPTPAVLRTEYIVKAITAEVLTILTIIACLTIIYFENEFKKCEGSGCAGVGMIIAIPIWCGFITLVTAIVLSSITLLFIHKLPREIRKSRSVISHTVAVGFLWIVLLIALAVAVYLLTPGH